MKRRDFLFFFFFVVVVVDFSFFSFFGGGEEEEEEKGCGHKKGKFSLPKVARSFLPLSFFPFFFVFRFFSFVDERERAVTRTRNANERTARVKREREREKSKQTDIHEDASVFLLSRSSVNACIEKSEREKPAKLRWYRERPPARQTE